jgi:hypothetical protein
MNKKDLNASDLKNAQNRATLKAKKLIRVLGLEDVVARNNKVFQINTDGTEKMIKESRFKSKKVTKGTFKLLK